MLIQEIEESEIYVQVTSQKTANKIKKTINGFETLAFVTKKSTLLLFLLTDKPSFKSKFLTKKIEFDIKKNILDFKDLIKKIRTLSGEKIEKIKNYLEIILRSKISRTICNEEETII